MRRRRPLLNALLTTVLVASAVLAPAAASPASAAAATNTDYCGGECSDILPPGENGDADLLRILASQALSIKPPHSSDQLAPYANLTYDYTGLTGAEINTFFNNGAYGVPAADVDSTTSGQVGHRRG